MPRLLSAGRKCLTRAICRSQNERFTCENNCFSCSVTLPEAISISVVVALKILPSGCLVKSDLQVKSAS